MNQHKDLLYRQKYATYKKKMLARNELIMFSGRFCKKKKKKNVISTTTEKSWLPHPRQGLYAKFQWEKLQFLSLLTTILKALICWKLGQGPYGGALDPTRMMRARCAMPGLHTNFFSWWPDRATKIINYQFLVARTGNLVARKKKSEMNGGNIRLRMTLKINVGCRKWINGGNIRLLMTLK